MAVPSVAQLAPVARFAPPPSDTPRRTKTRSCFSSISGAQLDSLPLLFSRTFPGLAGSFIPTRTPLACCFIYKNSRGCESGQLEKRTPYSCRCCLRVFTRKVECRMLSRISRFGLSGRRSTVEGVPLKIRSRVKTRFYCRKNNVSKCIRSQTQLEYFFEFRTGAGSSKNVKCDHRIVVNLHLHKHLRALASDISISNVTREETSSVESRSDVGVKISENGHQTNDEEVNSSTKSQVTFTNSETTEHSGSRSEGQTSTSSSSLDTVARGNFDNPALLSSSEAPMQTKEQRKIVRNAWEALVRWSRSWQMLNAHKTTDVLQKTKKVVVVGGGSFGTAMAVLLARNKSDMQVSLLLRDMSVCESINANHVNRKYFPNHQLPLNVIATADAKDAFEGAEYCIHAVPVQYSAAFLKSISEHVPPNLPFFSVSKGLELSTLEMMSQVIPRALGNPRQPVVVISGPSFSIELMDELPTALVAASKDKELARAAQQLLASRYLRINTSSDVIGVEIAGALKNVLAIAAGIVEGMNLGNNCMAALVAQGCSEIRWLAEKMGAKSATLAGLSGTGDIMLTCFVKLSRNRSVGVRLGSGEPLGEILASMNQVAEGVATAGAVIALARKYRVQMPVLTAVARILENELTPKKAVLELMSLPQVEEV